MANEIVKYRNRLNQIPLRKFNVREMNLFFSIASRFIEKGTQEITLSFSQLKRLSNYTDHGERFVQDLQKTYDKLIGISAYTDNGDEISRFVAFNEYNIKRSTQKVTIAVNPKFKKLFNDLVSSFTRFSLEEFARLKSTYAKTMFRLIKQFRTTGYLELKMGDFRNLLDIPKSYQSSDINKRILEPVKLELAPVFGNFSCKKLKEKKRGGKIVGYKFSWVPEAKNKNDFQDRKNHYQAQLNNISHNQFLKEKEKKASKKLIKDYYYKNKNYKNNHFSFIKQKENISKIGLGKKLVKTSNGEAKRILANFKKESKK